MPENHFLAISTVNGCCSVAVSNETVLLNTKSIIANKGYSEIIIPLIDTLLKQVKLKINQLTGFLVCTGPGNYTSLRVAISTARGLSLASQKPACGISLFELLSTNAAAVLVLIKGPSEMLYVQKFSNGLESTLPRLMTINEIAETSEFFYSETIGYRAKEVGELINSTRSLESTDICFKKFFSKGIKKLNKDCSRPAPLYIK